MRIYLFFILLILLVSCGNPVEKIDAKNLKTACDCANAAELIITERLDLQESALGKDAKEIESSDLKKRWTIMGQKQEEVLKVCNGKLEFNQCPEWKTIKKKLMDRGNELNKRIQEDAIKNSKN